jgi:hypothetical protein
MARECNHQDNFFIGPSLMREGGSGGASTKCTKDLAATVEANACALWSPSDNSLEGSVNVSPITDDGKGDVLESCSGTSDEVRSKRTSGCVRTGT